jgi:hypothetical protein
VSATQDTPTTDAQVTLAARLHAAADYIAARPELSVHQIDIDGGRAIVRNFGMNTADDLARTAKALGGRWEKIESRELFRLAREVADGVIVELVAWRSAVCERVVVGKETVEVPDPDAPTIEVERDIVEWRCQPILADREPQAA